MTDFQAQYEKTLNAVDDWMADHLPDWDVKRSGSQMEIISLDDKVSVISAQPSRAELWLATPLGGFHFKWEQNQWVTAHGDELLACLNDYIALHDEAVRIEAATLCL